MNRMFGGRWRFGLSAAAGMAALVLAFLFITSPRGQATAAEILARGAKAAAKLGSVHMRCQVRTLPADNFAMIAPERDFVATEAAGHGLMIRSADYKYICYPKDPVVQLFDMKNDPWETRNVAGEANYAGALADMRKRQAEWEGRLERFPGAPVSNNDRDSDDEGAGDPAPRDRRVRKKRG